MEFISFGIAPASGGGLKYGDYNMSMGVGAMSYDPNNGTSNLTANNNIAMGYNALQSMTSLGSFVPSANIGIGYSALCANGLYYGSGYALKGSNNTSIGAYSATLCSNNSSNNTFIGSFCNFDTILNQYNYSTAIGSKIFKGVN